MEAKICTPSDPNGDSLTSDAIESQPLPLGTTGELHVRGPNVFLGYHNNPAATADCLSPTAWFRTGDVGHLDPRGNLFITDRVKELIKYKGFQVAPAELEGYLLEHPLVDDCAVVGIQSEALGTEVPRAYVVVKGQKLTAVGQAEQDIAQWLNARVANHKKLRGGVILVKEIPKNASGKILRRVLKEWAKEESSRVQVPRVDVVRPRL